MVNLATPAPPLGFQTARLQVRRYVLADATRLHEAATESVETVFPFLPWCHPAYTLRESRDWIRTLAPAWEAGHTFGFAIYEREGKRFLGGCGLNRIDDHPVANLGYWLRTSATGNGFATEATLGLASFALSQLDIERVEIIMSVANTASKRVAERAGAVFEGKLRKRLRLHGECHDAFLYSLTRTDILG
ncbi:MAG: GNAT family N-acetyltransferase [Pseudomonadota bacterium]